MSIILNVRGSFGFSKCKTTMPTGMPLRISAEKEAKASADFLMAAFAAWAPDPELRRVGIIILRVPSLARTPRGNREITGKKVCESRILGSGLYGMPYLTLMGRGRFEPNSCRTSGDKVQP